MPTTTIQVALQNVSKTYPGGHRALGGLTLDVRTGELLVLVGPSGCGKSTTLRLIAGLDRPTAGRIEIGGKPMDRVRPSDRDVAMVFQNHALYPHMTAARNIAFALRGRGVARAEAGQRVSEMARTLAIEGVLGKKPGQLSGGERQRVALARALVRRPVVLLLDEPFSNLDSRLRATAREELRSLQRGQGITALHVTHDQEEAMTLGDRLAVLGDGVLQQVGTPIDLYTRPANVFVASVISSPPMNLIPGRIERGDGELCFLEASAGGGGSGQGLGAGDRLAVPAVARHALESRVGQPVLLGVRPQHMVLTSRGSDAPAKPGVAIHLTPTSVPPAMDQATLQARTRGGTAVVCRLPTGADPPVVGVERACGIEPDGMCWFEPGPFGRNLTVGM